LFTDIRSSICRMPWQCIKQQTFHTLPEFKDILYVDLFSSFACCKCRFQNRRSLLFQTHQTCVCVCVCARVRACARARVRMHAYGGGCYLRPKNFYLLIPTYYLYINDIQFFFNDLMNGIQGVYFTYSIVSTTAIFHSHILSSKLFPNFI
jgi:hypothetical protein